MTTTYLPVPVSITHESVRSDRPSAGRRLAKFVRSLGRRIVDHRSSPSVSDQVLSDVDVPGDFHR